MKLFILIACGLLAIGGAICFIAGENGTGAALSAVAGAIAANV